MAKVYYSEIRDESDYIINCKSNEDALIVAKKMEKDFISHKSDEFPTVVFGDDGEIIAEYHWKW